MKVKEIMGEICCLTSVYPEGYPIGFSQKQHAYYDSKAFCLYASGWRFLHPEAGEWEVVSQRRDHLTGNLFVDCRIPEYHAE